MAVALTFGFDDLHVTMALSEARSRSVNLKPALRSIGREGVKTTRRRFQNGRGPDGEAWAKGHKATGQTLIEKGLLLRSISDRPPTENSVEWGSNRVYAAIHQTGGTIKPINGKALKFSIGGGFVTVASVKMPARPYLGANDQDMAAFADILLRHIAPQPGDAA